MELMFVWILGFLFTWGFSEADQDSFLDVVMNAVLVSLLWPLVLGIEVREVINKKSRGGF